MQFAVRLSVVGLVALCAVGLVSANRAAGEQTLPTGWVSNDCPYYIQDGADLQYFPSGPEFKLQREAAAMKAYKTDLEAKLACGQE
jgi:hypothetical protein